MTKARFLKLFLAMPILLLAVGTAYATGNTLTAASSTVSLTYQLPATPGASVSVAFTATSANTFFYVEQNTVPTWLSVTSSGTAGTSAVTTGGAADLIAFSANPAAGTMPPGTYTANVVFQSAATGNPTATVVVSLWVKEVNPGFTVTPSGTGFAFAGTATAQTATMTWSQGSAAPALNINCTSSGDPMAYAITITGNGNAVSAMSVSPAGGIAYTWGSVSSTVTFNTVSLAFLSAAVNASLAGTVTITPTVAGGGTPITIAVTITVAPPAPTITGVSPPELPVASTGNAVLVVSGTGFSSSFSTVKASTDNTTWNTLFAPTGGPYTAVVFANPDTMVVTLPCATYTNPGTPPGAVYLKVTDTGVTGTGTITVVVTTAPIIYAVTNSASYLAPASGSNPQVAAYELLSIFGANFDPGAASAVVATPNSLGMYATSLTDSTTTNTVTVSFNAGSAAANISAGTATDQGDAPILFASNNQINIVVPSTVASLLGTNNATTTAGANIIVTVANSTNSTNLVSDITQDPMTVDVVAASPGIFTPDGSGRGQAAVLNHDWSLNSSSNPETRGNYIHIYATGLGVPTSATNDAYDAGTGSYPALAYPNNCVAPGAVIAGPSANGYLGILTGYINPPTAAGGATAGASALSAANSNLANIDGAVINPAYLYGYATSATANASLLPPCFATASAAGITAKLGTSVTVLNPSYAGFVSGSIAGLNQIDLQLPTTVTPTPATAGSATALVISDGLGPGSTSQALVTVYVK
jgi:uncharacterized protein (TIGR03437 family)